MMALSGVRSSWTHMADEFAACALGFDSAAFGIGQTHEEAGLLGLGGTQVFHGLGRARTALEFAHKDDGKAAARERRPEDHE